MKIREYRHEKGLTVNQLADAVGVSQATMSRYELGTRMPEPEIMTKIAEVTGGRVQPNDFYDLPNNDNGPDDPEPGAAALRADDAA